MGPMRDPGCDIRRISTDTVRSILLRDFDLALCQVRASVAEDQLGALVEWDRQYGSFSGTSAPSAGASAAAAPPTSQPLSG